MSWSRAWGAAQGEYALQCFTPGGRIADILSAQVRTEEGDFRGYLAPPA